MPAPVYVAQPHRARAFHPSPLGIGVGACLLLLVPLMYLRGRPRRATGGAGGPRPEPPPGMRPAQASALMTGKVGSLQVVATFADLAARGHLRIEDRGDDFVLIRRTPPRQDLAGYEVTLLRAVFASLEEKPVSHLKYWFARVIAQVREEILGEAVRLGAFRRRPDRQRKGQMILGGVLLATSWLMFIFSLIATNVGGVDGLGFVPVCQAVAGLSLLLLSPRVRPLTALGSDLYAQVTGFRNFLRDIAPPDGPPERLEAVLSAHLPYAIVFGLAPGYTARFAAVGVRAPGWYVAHDAGDRDFSSRFATFTTTASSTMSATQSSGGGFSSGGSGFSGGSSGGGGGGGGGGSW